MVEVFIMSVMMTTKYVDDDRDDGNMCWCHLVGVVHPFTLMVEDSGDGCLVAATSYIKNRYCYREVTPA